VSIRPDRSYVNDTPNETFLTELFSIDILRAA
jgi:hypothetical protein